VFTPDKESVQVKLTVTGTLFQPKTFGGIERWLVTIGGVRSMLMLSSVADDELPALSVQVPVADCEDPSLVSASGVETELIPERESTQAYDTVTGLLFHPNELARGLLDAVMMGPVRSMFMLVSVAVAELPALSTHVPVAVWLAPSWKVTGDARLRSPERESLQLKLTVTGALFHPFPFGGIERELVMIGDVRSTFTPT